MRNIWLVAMVAVGAAGCDGVDGKPWDKNQDGLVGQCEGLDKFFCGLYPGCQGQESFCTMDLACREDGNGGCLPCNGGFECVPRPAPACSDLNSQQCSADPRCVTEQAVCTMICADDGQGGCLPCGGTVCRDRNPPPIGCGLVPINSCASIPSCEVQTVTVCAANRGGIAADPTNPSTGCIGPDACTSTQVCVNKVTSCEARALDTCTADPACQVEQGGLCDVYCAPGAACPPCASPSRCVTKPSTGCETRAIDQCTATPGCALETLDCAAVCQDDGMGDCLPCPSKQRCVTAAAPPPAPGPEPMPPTP